MNSREVAGSGDPFLAEIQDAAGRIAPYIRATPLEDSPALSQIAGEDVYLKCECLQRTGSFKLRGALNALLRRVARPPARGVVTASAGNHGLGAAFAARLLGVPAIVFIPADAPEVKQRRIAALGAEVRRVAGDYDAAHLEATEYAERIDIPYLHAYSDPAVVAGQGTVGLEIVSALSNVGTVVVPVGGGGLIGGVGAGLRGLGLKTRIIGVQSEATGAMHASLSAGAPTSVPAAPTLCDGLAGDVDETSLALTRSVVDDFFLVPESAVADAIRGHFYEDGLTVEGSGAVAAAALRAGMLKGTPGPIALILTGGNLDVTRLAEILDAEVEKR